MGCERDFGAEVCWVVFGLCFRSYGARYLLRFCYPICSYPGWATLECVE